MAVLVAAAVVCPSVFGEEPAPAQTQTQAAPAAAAQQVPNLDEKELNELIKTIMTTRLSKELALNDEQTVLMVRRLTELRDQMDEVKKKRAEAIKDLRGALKSGKTDDEIQPKLEALMALDKRGFDLRQKTYERLSENLSLAQRAKVYVFLSEFPNEMRRLAQQARERAMRAAGIEVPKPQQRQKPERPAQQEPQPSSASDQK
jgi:hypothetical protein